MYSVDDSIKALALAPARHIYSRAIFGTKSGTTWDNDRTYTDTDHIISAKISIGSGNGGLTIGAAYSAKLTLQLMGDVNINQTDRIIMRVGFYKSDGTKSDPIGLGWFYVDTITRKDNITTIVAYDKMLRGAKIYKPTALTFPCRASAILDDICDKMGVSLRDGVAMPYDPIINEAPTKGKDSDGNTLYYTRREILGYLASIMGGNWFFDAGGHLAFTQFEAVSDTFAAANSTAADISSDAYVVTGITWNINGVPYSRFDDEDAAGMLEFSNPLKVDAKEPIMGAVEQRLVGLTYHSGTIQRQGCGWFELGDIVTAYRKDGTSSPVLITGINYSIEGGAYTEKIFSSALSDSESNYTSGDISGQTVPQSVAQEEAANGSGGIVTLTSYEYLTDLSVKLNGVTYTAEKDETTGLISRITDSGGNSLEPTINSGVTDVALHNAVFMAAAVCRGIGAPKFVLDGIMGLFTPETRDIANNRWRNSISGYNDMTLTGGSTSENAVHFNAGEYGSFVCDEPNTIYTIYKALTEQKSDYWQPIITKHTIFSRYCGFDLFNYHSTGNTRKICFSAIGSDVMSEVDATDYHVICVTRNSSAAYLYIDGELVGSATSSRGHYYGNMLINGLRRDSSSGNTDTAAVSDMIMCAFGTSYHDEATVRKNMAYLANKYLGTVH